MSIVGKSTRLRLVSGGRFGFPAAYAAGLALLMASNALAESPPFSYETVRATARKLADTEYRPDNRPDLPEFFKKLSYDDYQSIRFIPAAGPWEDQRLRFTFQFFHRGFIYQDPVRIHLIEEGQVHDFQFSPSQFDYGKNKAPAPPPGDFSFAGLRVLFPLNVSNKQDEVAAFLGASYFRLIGAHQKYGASVRALAVDTAEPSGEEFPRFTEFWIEKPGPLDNSLRLYGLLDSPSVSGAYRFVIQPGEITQVEVESSLFMRKPVKKLGIAPLTSMFLVGENRTRFVPDFRPEVHDSDGLLLNLGGTDWIWRPLVNPEKDHMVSQFPANKIKGFGLLQRDRQFDHYQDLAAREELRPSLWVEPRQDWATGRVELVEIPTPAEWNDNIVTYWVPQQNPQRGEESHWSYRVSACITDPQAAKLLRVESTRINPAQDKKAPRFVVDFSAKDGPALPANAEIETSVHTSQGTIRNLVTEKNEVTGGWRTFFDLADASKPADLRLYLHKGSEVLSETWTCLYRQP
jgi:glucans biosynthesis protein